MFDIAVICSSIEARKPLLERSLQTWMWDAEQSGLSVAIRVYCNGYEQSFDHPIPENVDLQIQYDPMLSGSHITGYNFWWERTEAKVYCFTHPDLLYQKGTIRAMYDHAKPNTFVSFPVLWLPPYVTENIDNYPWQTPEQFEFIEDVYRLDPQYKGERYWNVNLHVNEPYRSTTNYAMEAETLKKIFPFPDMHEQGSDDVYHLILRNDLGIKDYTIKRHIIAHQYHPQTWSGDTQRACDQAVELLHLYRQTGGDPHETYRLAESVRAKWGIPSTRS